MPPSPSGLHIGQVRRTDEAKLQSPPRTTAGSSSASQRRKFRSASDKRFDSFKTWSGKLERQISNLRGIPQESDVEADSSEIAKTEHVPEVRRYFDALQGPELDTLRVRDLLPLILYISMPPVS